MGRSILLQLVAWFLLLLSTLMFSVSPAHAQFDTGKVRSIDEIPFEPQGEQISEFLSIVELEQKALAQERQGNCTVAEPLYQQAFEAKRNMLGQRHSLTLNSWVSLSRCLAKRGQFEAALSLREREWDERGWTSGTHGEPTVEALEWIRRTGEEAARIAPTPAVYEALGRAYAQLYLVDRHDLLAIPDAAKTNVLQAAIDHYDLSETRDGGGDTGPAVALLEAVLLQKWDIADATSIRFEAQSRYAKGLSERGRLLDAEFLVFGLVAEAKGVLGPDHPKTIEYILQHAALTEAIGFSNDALSLAHEAHTLAQQSLADDDPLRSLARFVVLNQQAKLSNTQDDLAELGEAVRQLDARLGTSALQSLYAKSDYAMRLIQNGQVSDGAEQLELARQRAYAREDLYMLNHGLFDERLGYAKLHNPGLRDTAFGDIDGAQVGARMQYEINSYSPGLGQELDHTLNTLGVSSRLALDALWFTLPKQTEADREYSRQHAFTLAQETLKGGASSSIAEKAAIEALDRRDVRLGNLARQRRNLTNRWRELDQNVISQITGISYGASSPGMPAGVAAERDEIRREVKRLDELAWQNAPEYFQIRFPSVTTIPEAQELLAADEAMVLLVPTEFGTHSYLVTKSGTYWHRSDWAADKIGSAVRRLLMDVGATVQMGDDEYDAWLSSRSGENAFDRATAFALYNELLAPHKDQLAGKRHLFFAADGVLSNLPLSILVTQQPQGPDHDAVSLRSTAWFADQVATVQVPSVNAWAYLRRSPSQVAAGDARSFAGFGDPVLAGASQTRGSAVERRRRSANALKANDVFERRRPGSGTRGVRAGDLRKLARLPGTVIELDAMRNALGAGQSDVRLGALATETAVKQADLAGVNILAFATHGLVAGELHGLAEPGLVLTPPVSATIDDDGLLTASEVAVLDLDAEWVILSACNTAAGDGSEGAEGLSGLASAFFYAGAQSILASHWPVRDDVASKLTVRIIEIRAENPQYSRAQAFQQAMREIREDSAADKEDDSWAHPNAWAPFTLIGG